MSEGKIRVRLLIEPNELMSYGAAVEYSIPELKEVSGNQLEQIMKDELMELAEKMDFGLIISEMKKGRESQYYSPRPIS